MGKRLHVVILGLSITSSWGNGHATTYRALVRELEARGHDVLFLEREAPWYAHNRDLPEPPFGRTRLYSGLDDLKSRFARAVCDADLCIVGSYVPQGSAVGEWVIDIAKGTTAFYDIDTPVTLGKLERGEFDYLTPQLIPQYDLYLSFTGGPTLEHIERRYGSPMARPLYCCFDPALYYPIGVEKKWDLGYMGTYSDDRQPLLDLLMLEPARRASHYRMVVVGPQYPACIQWPTNIERIEHLPPARHRAFYNAQRFTLNLTRADMSRAGYSPSVRLFEAAACATPVISDYWAGLDSFFEIGKEIFVAASPEETLQVLCNTTEEKRRAVGERARASALAEHTAGRRVAELESYVFEHLAGCRKPNLECGGKQLGSPAGQLVP
jgi:spore maturation protein CgeB